MTCIRKALDDLDTSIRSATIQYRAFVSIRRLLYHDRCREWRGMDVSSKSGEVRQ